MTNPIYHHADPADLALVAAIREQNAPFKGINSGVEAREGYDLMIAAIPEAENVEYSASTVGGVSGFWCKPKQPAAKDRAILYLHGGAYILGSAKAYCNFAGQIAARTGISVFVADYGLAPEQPFPKGVEDARAVWRDLGAAGFTKLAIAGDSAGGGLSLSLLEWATREAEKGRGKAPAACAVFSPWLDLALTGESHVSKAEEEPYLTFAMLKSSADLYLGGNDPRTAAASPLYGDPSGLPPIQIHTGTAEILLDDSLSYAAKIHQSGGRAEAHIWNDMPHVFPASFTLLKAGEQALAMTAAFLRTHLGD